MDENRMRFGVGVLVVSAIAVGALLTLMFGAAPRVLNDDYTLSVVFPSSEGVNPDSPVVRDGVKIGRVEDIRLLEEGGVLMTLALDRDQKLTHRYVPKIGAGNFVTGDAKLEFVRATPREIETFYVDSPDLLDQAYTDGEFFRHGDRVQSLFAIQDDVSQTLRTIAQAGESIAGAGDRVGELAVNANDVIGGTDAKIDRVADEAVKALEELQAAIRDVRRITGDDRLKQNLDRSVEQFPGLLEEVGRTLKTTQTTFQRFDDVGERFDRVGASAEAGIEELRVGLNEVVREANSAAVSFRKAGDQTEQTVVQAREVIDDAEQTFQNLSEITRPIAQRSDAIADSLVNNLQSLDRTLNQAESFITSLNRSEGTVGRLIKDPELYYRIRRAVENIELATARVRPILDDVRIFTDKVARDPRQLGVRGALTKRPTGTGRK